MQLDRIIQIDLGRFPLKYIFLGIVFFLTMISFTGESSHASELNALPWNRTEISNIKNITMDLKDGVITVNMFIDYIFDISLIQHFNFIHLDLIGEGASVSIPFSSNNEFPEDFPKNNSITFDCPLFGNFTARLLRSRTLLYERNFTNLPIQKRTNTSVFCHKNALKEKECDVANFCFKPKRLFWFSKDPIVFSHDPLQLEKSTIIVTKEAPTVSLLKFVESQQIEDIYTGASVIVSFNSYKPYSWEWIENVAAPIADIAAHNEKIDKFFCLNAPKHIIDSDFLSLLGSFTPISDDETACLELGKYRILNYADGMYDALRKRVFDEIGEFSNQHKTVVLTSKSTSKYFSNIMEAAKVITKCSDPYVIDIDTNDELKTIKDIYRSEFVISAPGNETSQAFWIKNGTFIELVPHGFECDVNGFAPAQKANVGYKKLIFDENGKIYKNETESFTEKKNHTLCNSFPKKPLEINLTALPVF